MRDWAACCRGCDERLVWWQLLISLDELYYRIYYLAQSSAGMGSVLPDPSAYFNG